MSTQWEDRDLPVLRAVVQLFSEGRDRASDVQVVQRTGLSISEVRQSLKVFEASDYFTRVSRTMAAALTVMGVTEKAMIRSGAWPSEDNGVESLVKALEEAANQDSEKAPMLTRAAQAIRNVGIDVTAKIATEYMTKAIGS